MGHQQYFALMIVKVNVELEPVSKRLAKNETQKSFFLFCCESDWYLVFIQNLILVPGFKSEHFPGFEALIHQYPLVILELHSQILVGEQDLMQG
jgi:hypothetical protein